jgi:cysteine-rich repeat protein
MRYLILSFTLLFACSSEDTEPMHEVVCGDGVVEGTEACDDGNGIDGDECSNTCVVPGCGDGVVNFAEACDDGNDVEGDGCDTNCTQSFCGNGVQAPDESCDDGNTVSGDGCDDTCKPTGCGNGSVSAGEDCDAGNAVEGDGCDSNCTMSACGNSVVGGTEQCDDGNTTSADGCSSACTEETLEMEPNDDGTPNTGALGIVGNDFDTAAPDANGEITESTAIVATLDPAGDEDIFKLANHDAVPKRVKLDTWNLASGFGIGVPCGPSIDTGIQVKNAAGTVLAENDDLIAGTQRCSTLTFGLLPGEVVYVQIMDFDDNEVIPSYALVIDFAPAVCGDGVLGAGETCDDTNTTAGDGCSAMCQLENSLTEVEPNEDGSPQTGGSGINGNDFSTVHPLSNGAIANDTTLIGALSPVGDEDIYAITNIRPNPVNVTFETWSLAFDFGIGVPCGATVDTALVIRDAAGTSLANNNDRSGTADQCSKLTYSMFPGETRFLHVVEDGDNLAVPKYALVVKFDDVVCGDNVIGLGEQCDDGNTMSGDNCSSTCQIEPFCGDSIMQPSEQCDDGNNMPDDGCDSTCQVEDAVTEIEPNDDGSTSTGGSTVNGNDFATEFADANGAFTTSVRIVGRNEPVGDEDVFAFRNPGTTSVVARFDLWNNAPGFGVGVTCGTSTTSIDTVLQIRDAAGTSLAFNDDRISSDNCSALSFAIAPGQTVYAHVSENGDNKEMPSYTLDVVYTPLANAANEVEPNDDGATNTSASGITGNDFAIANANANGAFTSSTRVIARLTAGTSNTSTGDEDVFKFTNPTAAPVLARFNTWNLLPGFGLGVPCGTSINTGLNIRNAAGTTVLDSNDDRNSSDQCSSVTVAIAPGDSVFAHVVENGDNALIAAYVLDVVYVPIVCGDGLVAPSEECDDSNTANGDGCSNTCQWELVCGNGVLQAGEQCDDANTAANDGCSATCTLESTIAEMEPNDTATQAMTSPLQISGDAFISAAIGTPGDIDIFQVTVATATTVRFETFSSWGDCSTTALDLRVFDMAGTQVVTDLFGTGIDECGAISIFLDAGIYQVQVEERGSNATVGAYLLQIAFQGDTGTETEPNGTTATASANLANETYVFGDHMMIGDVDVYAITVPGNARIRAEVVEGNRQNETCESGNIDSHLILLDETGTQIADDNDSGRGLCSLIDGTGSAPLNPGARNSSPTTPKTYYLVVRASGFATPNGGQFVYRLQVTVR